MNSLFLASVQVLSERFRGTDNLTPKWAFSRIFRRPPSSPVLSFMAFCSKVLLNAPYFYI